MTESGRMHRKTAEEAASGANADDDNETRRRAGPSGAAEHLRARPPASRVRGPLTVAGVPLDDRQGAPYGRRDRGDR